MWAVVLVGGFGTRLRPLTLTRPKQMLPIVGVPMIERVVAWLGGQDVTDVVLSLGYRADVFEEAYPDGFCAGVQLHYAVEPEPLDTAGAIRFAADHAGLTETFFAMNGDVLTDLDLGALLSLHRDRSAEATIALTRVEDPSRYGVVPIAADNRVIEFVEKPAPGTAPSHWINAGSYVIEPSVLHTIPLGEKTSIERVTFPALAASGSLYGFESDAYWIDTGTPETYVQAQLDLCSGRREVVVDPIDPSAVIHPSARFTNSVAMEGVVVGADAVVDGSVMCPGAAIGDRGELRDSVLGQDAKVGIGASLSELSVIGDGEIIAAGERLSAHRRPSADT